MIPLKDDVEAQSFPIVNILLIVGNIAAFLFELAQPSSFIMQWGVVPQRMVQQHDLGQVMTMLTSMFMHGGWMHLLGNMWFLWIFGDNVEDRIGHVGYLVFYILCGMAGDVAQILVTPSSTIPSIGASGAIAGVMGAYMMLYPDARIKMFFGELWLFTADWPAWMVIGEWWLMQFFFAAIVRDNSSHIGYLAHLGGFLAGFLLIGLIANRHGELALDYDHSEQEQ